MARVKVAVVGLETGAEFIPIYQISPWRNFSPNSLKNWWI
jgi:hypothetical protein